MSWFLIAKDDNDAERWGCGDGCLLLVVGEDGSITKLTAKQIANGQSGIPKPTSLALLNIKRYPKGISDDSVAERNAILACFRATFPTKNIEGIFVHFGGSDPEASDRSKATIQDEWQNPGSYPGLADVFEDIDVFPYSATIKTGWSKPLDELAATVTTFSSCIPESVRAQLPKSQSLLQEAKKLAFPRYGNQRDESKKTRMRCAARQLMPAFIYLDGLLYAHGIKNSTERDQKVRDMESVIGEDILGVLSAIPKSLRQVLPPAIRGQIDALESGGGDLRGVARTFCDDYKRFLKDVMPESATAGETQQETKP